METCNVYDGEPSFDRKIMGLRFCYEFGMKTQYRLMFIPFFGDYI